MPYNDQFSLTITIGRDDLGREFRAILNEAESISGQDWNASEFVRQMVVGGWRRIKKVRELKEAS